MPSSSQALRSGRLVSSVTSRTGLGVIRWTPQSTPTTLEVGAVVQRFTATSNKAEALPGPLRLIVASARPSGAAATSADHVDGKSRRRRGNASDSVSSMITFLIPRNRLVQETTPVNAHPAASQCADLMGRRASNSGPMASCVAKKPTPVSTDPANARANTEPRPGHEACERVDEKTRATRPRQLVHHLSCVPFASVEVAGPGDVILTEGTNGSPSRNGQRCT